MAGVPAKNRPEYRSTWWRRFERGDVSRDEIRGVALEDDARPGAVDRWVEGITVGFGSRESRHSGADTRLTDARRRKSNRKISETPLPSPVTRFLGEALERDEGPSRVARLMTPFWESPSPDTVGPPVSWLTRVERVGDAVPEKDVGLPSEARVRRHDVDRRAPEDDEAAVRRDHRLIRFSGRGLEGSAVRVAHERDHFVRSAALVEEHVVRTVAVALTGDQVRGLAREDDPAPVVADRVAGPLRGSLEPSAGGASPVDIFTTGWVK